MNRRLALKLMAAAPACAQQRKRRPQPASSMPPTPVAMDAVVTDSGGNPVRDLTPGDFTISDGGETRVMDSFAAVDAVSGAARAAQPLPLPMKIDPGSVHRAFVLVVDDCGLSAAAAQSLRDALAGFVQQLGDRDTAVLFRSSQGSGGMEQLTSDRRLLADAMARVVFHPAETAPSTPPWPETLDYTLEGLRGVNGRKAAVVLFERAPKAYNFGSLITLANRAWTSVYAIDLAPEPHTEVQDLASATGGLYLQGNSSAALTRILKDQSAFYLLGFHADAAAAAGQDKPVTVKLARGGLTLRARRNPPATKPASYLENGLPDAELRRLTTAPIHVGNMQLRLSARYTRVKTDWLEVRVEADAHDIAITHKLDETYQGEVDFLLRLYDSDGEVAYDRYLATPLALTPDQYRRMLDEGLNYTVRVPAMKPGVFQLCAAVRDGTSSNTGIAYRTVEVPNLANGDLTLSGVALQAGASAEVDVVRRVFHPGQQIDYECSIYNVSVDQQTNATVEVRTRIYSATAVVYAGDAQNLTAKNVANRSLTVRGKLNLAAKIATGDFVFQLTVIDKLAPGEKPRTASQWVGFTIR